MRDRVLAASYVKQTPSHDTKGKPHERLRTRPMQPRVLNRAPCDLHTNLGRSHRGGRLGAVDDIADDDDDEDGAIRVAGRGRHVVRG